MINKEKDKEWDDLVRDCLKKQREARGAKVKYQQIRQEIADLAIRWREDEGYKGSMFWNDVTDKVKILRALEQQYPSVKELT